MTSILAILILFLIASIIGRADIIDELRTASPALIALSIPVYLISWPLRGIRYQQILAEIGVKEDLNFLVGCIAVSQSANVFLPARIGDVARAYLLKKVKNISWITGLSSLVVERMFDIIAITVIGGFAVLGLRGMLLDQWVTDVITIAGLATVTVFGILVLFLKLRTTIGGVIDRFIREIALVSTNPRAFAIVLTGSLLVWLVDTLTCFVILNAFSEQISLSMIPVIFLAIAVGNLTKIFPITPGSIGPYEAVLTGIFSLGGIDTAIGFAAAVLDHFVKNLVTLILGRVYLSRFDLSWSQLVEQSEQQ
uniref:Glycosyltransferase AglD n=1 Tax=Candidatus Methanogaster sp. ANME-2c ERB4 TaxID=2759911 RepID=A0A7G9YMG2_9EURY|nr:dolichol-P-glucose synthetase [uncultured archaeon GZfos17F1]QNO49196.1 glycosyltransferase AglD [Methanosarcinales archaeon ANME-2c ERB4]